MPDLQLSLIIGAIDNASQVVAGVGNALLQLASGNVMGAVGTAAAAIGTAVVDVGVQASQMAADYEQSMTMVQALTGSNAQQMAQYDAQLKQLAVDAGVAPTALSQGLYNVISAGFQSKQAMDVLTLATEDAKIGMTDATTTSLALTKVLNAFQVPASQFNTVNGMMMTTVRLGAMTMGEYAGSIAKTATYAVQYHDSMADMNAALSTLTIGTKNATIAGIDYDNLLKVLNGNTTSVADAARRLNPAFDANKFAAMSVADKVAYLNTMIVEHGHNISDVIGKQQNAAQAFTVLSTHLDMYRTNLKALSDQQAMAKITADQWATTQQGLNQQMSRLSAAVDVLMINLGNQLLPLLSGVVGWVAGVISAFNDWETSTHGIENAINGAKAAIAAGINAIGDALQGAAQWFRQWGAAVIWTALAITVFFLPALIKAGAEAAASGAKIAASFVASMVRSGVEAVVSSAKITASFVVSLVKAGIEGWASAGKLASFIGSMVASGAQAVASGAKIAGQFVASLVTSGVQAAASGAKITAQFVGSMVATGTQAIAAGARITASFVGSMIASGVQAAVAGAKIAASFVASLIASGAQAVVAAAKIVASFVASLVTTGVRAAATGATMMASLVPSILSVSATAIMAAATAIPGLVMGFLAWAGGAMVAAGATLAATWPILAIVAIVVAVVAAIVLAVQHWGQIAAWLQGVWSAFSSWFSSWFASLGAMVQGAWQWITGIFTGAMGWLTTYIAAPLQNLWNQFSGWMSGLGKMFQGAWQWISGIFVSALNWLIGLVNNAVKWIVNVFNQVAGAVHATGLSVSQIPTVGGGGMPGGGGPSSTMPGGSPTGSSGGSQPSFNQSLANTPTPTTSAVNTASGAAATRHQQHMTATTAQHQAAQQRHQQHMAVVAAHHAAVQKHHQQVQQHHKQALAAKAAKHQAALKHHQQVLAAHAARHAQAARHHQKLVATVLSTACPESSGSTPITSAAGVALPNYAAGTGYMTANTPYTQPAATTPPVAITVHVHTSDKDPEQYGKRVAETVKKELAKMLRQQSVAPRYTSGGTR